METTVRVARRGGAAAQQLVVRAGQLVQLGPHVVVIGDGLRTWAVTLGGLGARVVADGHVAVLRPGQVQALVPGLDVVFDEDEPELESISLAVLDEVADDKTADLTPVADDHLDSESGDASSSADLSPMLNKDNDIEMHEELRATREQVCVVAKAEAGAEAAVAKPTKDVSPASLDGAEKEVAEREGGAEEGVATVDDEAALGQGARRTRPALSAAAPQREGKRVRLESVFELSETDSVGSSTPTPRAVAAREERAPAAGPTAPSSATASKQATLAGVAASLAGGQPRGARPRDARSADDKTSEPRPAKKAKIDAQPGAKGAAPTAAGGAGGGAASAPAEPPGAPSSDCPAPRQARGLGVPCPRHAGLRAPHSGSRSPPLLLRLRPRSGSNIVAAAPSSGSKAVAAAPSNGRKTAVAAPGSGRQLRRGRGVAWTGFPKDERDLDAIRALASKFNLKTYEKTGFNAGDVGYLVLNAVDGRCKRSQKLLEALANPCGPCIVTPAWVRKSADSGTLGEPDEFVPDVEYTADRAGEAASMRTILGRRAKLVHGVLAGKRLVLDTAIDEGLQTAFKNAGATLIERVSAETSCVAIANNDASTAFIQDMRRKHIVVFLKDLLLDQLMLATALDDKRYRVDQPAARQAR
jgi:hypothetical protein